MRGIAMQKKLRSLLWAAFVVYCAVMCYLLFARPVYNIGKPYLEELKMNINLIPFRTIQEYAFYLINRRNVYLVYDACINLFGNIAAFIPLGFFLPCFWKKLRSIKRLLFCSGIVIIMVELIQLFTLRGCCDIDDLILNLFGAFLGFLLFRGLSRILLKRRS